MARPNRSESVHPPRGERDSTAFLLAQVGAHAAIMFGARLQQLRLSRPHCGILWNLSFSPSITQRQLAARLHIPPSRLVALLDELESRGLLVRRRDPADRRRHSLHLAQKGRATVTRIMQISAEHQQDLLAALPAEDQNRLGELLDRIAVQQGLTRGVHPGYARMGSPVKAGK